MTNTNTKTTDKKPTYTPHVGEIVLYHHPEDGKWWPSLVLEVTEADGPPEGVQALLCYLQIFRPRGNDWKRVSEGTNPGQWSPIKDVVPS